MASAYATGAGEFNCRFFRFSRCPGPLQRSSGSPSPASTRDMRRSSRRSRARPGARASTISAAPDGRGPMPGPGSGAARRTSDARLGWALRRSAGYQRELIARFEVFPILRAGPSVACAREIFTTIPALLPLRGALRLSFPVLWHLLHRQGPLAAFLRDTRASAHCRALVGGGRRVHASRCVRWIMLTRERTGNRLNAAPSFPVRRWP